MTADVTLITPTGDRPEAFRLCERWMGRQSFPGRLQWLVVDDGCVPTPVSLGQICIRRDPADPASAPTLAANLLAALDRVESDKILIIEDDDWYREDYVQVMAAHLERHDLVGERISRYYNVRFRKWRIFRNRGRTSLCQTAFRRSLLGLVRQACARPGRDLVSTRTIWKTASSRLLFDTPTPLCVGIKSMPGRAGIGAGHRAWLFRSDPGLEKLRQWTGDDCIAYAPYYHHA